MSTEIFVFGLLNWSTRGQCCSEHETLDEMIESEVGPLDATRLLLLKAIYYLLVFIAAPIAAPIVGFLMLREGWAVHLQDKRERDTFHELLLDPLHSANVPDQLQPFLDEHTPAAISAGFQPLGDFWLKDAPMHSKARIFLHASGECFFEIGITNATLYFECISFLNDGSMIYTARCSFPKARARTFAKHGVMIHPMPDCQPAELIAAHEQHVTQLSSEVGVPIRQISESQWRDYFCYHNRKFALAKYHIDELSVPPVCEFPKPNEPVAAEPVLQL